MELKNNKAMVTHIELNQMLSNSGETATILVSVAHIAFLRKDNENTWLYFNANDFIIVQEDIAKIEKLITKK